MNKLNMGGIEWEQVGEITWQADADGECLRLDRHGPRGWAVSFVGGRGSEYRTRREAVEGARCVTEFVSGNSVDEVALVVFGNHCRANRVKVEVHLRRWLR